MPKTKAAKAKAKAKAAKATETVEAVKADKIKDMSIEELGILVESMKKELAAELLLRQEKELRQEKINELDKLSKQIYAARNTQSYPKEIGGVKPIQLVEPTHVEPICVEPMQPKSHSPWVTAVTKHGEVTSVQSHFAVAVGKSESRGNIKRQVDDWENLVFDKQVEIRKDTYGREFVKSSAVPVCKKFTSMIKDLADKIYIAVQRLIENPDEKYIQIELNDKDCTCMQSKLISSRQCQELVLSYGIARECTVPLLVEQFEGEWFAVIHKNN